MTAIVLAMSTTSWADADPKRVLILHSFGLRFKPWTERTQVIRSEMSRRKSLDFHDHSLVSARLAGDKSEGPFVDYLHALRVPSETKNVDMNHIVAETVKFLSAEARSRDIVLGGKLNGTALRINGDPIQLQQVLSNLILNGV